MLVDTISELGIFGVIIGFVKNSCVSHIISSNMEQMKVNFEFLNNSNAKEILHNSVGGHMLRTKLSTANEGGVAAGLGALDSPYLIDL